MTALIPTLTEEDAMAAYRALVSWMNDTYGEHIVATDHPLRQGDSDPAWFGRPVLVADFAMWHEPTAWAVVWEGGPHDWATYAVRAALDGDLVLPAGVGIDCFSSFAVSLYPETPVVLP